MKTTACLVALVALVSAGCKKEAAPSAAQAPLTEEQKTVYALGLMLGKNLGPLKLTPAEVEMVQKGLADAVAGRKTDIQPETYGPKLQELAKSRAAQAAECEKSRAQGFLDDAAKEQGAVRTPSGLVSRTLKPGNGAAPSASDVVRVHYEGKLTDGTVFDSSLKRGQPVEFALNQVIPCWTEGVQRMKVGEKARLVCPSQIAYGDQGRPPQIPGGATLVFEVELLGIKK